MVSWLIFGFGGLSVESNRLHHYTSFYSSLIFFTEEDISSSFIVIIVKKVEVLFIIGDVIHHSQRSVVRVGHFMHY